MDPNTIVLLVWAVGLTILFFIGKLFVNYWFEIKKHNAYMEGQIKLLALIAAANDVSIDKIAEIVAATGIKVNKE